MYLKPSEVVRRAEGSSNQGVHGKTKQTPAENHMMHKRRAGYTALPPAPAKAPHVRRGVPSSSKNKMPTVRDRPVGSEPGRGRCHTAE